MSTRITTLVENTQGEHLALRCEHGISFFIEKDGFRMLFDLGQTDLFIQNASRIGIDPLSAEFVAISHGHYDHSGGFKALVKAGFKGTLATGSGFFDRKYASDGISLEYLGNDFDEAYLNNVGIAHKVCCNWVERIADGIFILSAFPRVHPSETPNPRFLVERGGRMVKDDFGDEISIAVGSSKGFILILGCSHPGVMNILDSARSSLPGPIFAVIGGTHLVEASPERLKESVDYLDGMDIETIGVSHCTGVKGVAALSERAHGFYRNTTGHSLFVPMNSDLACTAANRR